MQYKLVSLAITNTTRQHAIQTFKVHFILILAGLDNKFPLSLWCHLLKPTKLTMNLLCQLKLAPTVSAYAHVHGPHDYMKKPFAPLGCAIQAHVEPEDRRTWDTWSDASFRISTLKHHRCNWVYITKIWATQICDTVFFKRQYITNPTVSPEYHMVAVAQQLTIMLQANIPNAKNCPSITNSQKAIHQNSNWQKTRQQRPRPIATGFAQPKQHNKQHTFQGWRQKFQGWKHQSQGWPQT